MQGNTGMYAIETQGLGKTYRTGFWLNRVVVSLQNCSLKIKRGETFGLLGPNGAGKTTLLKILLGITAPTSGTATVLGWLPGQIEAKQRIGYLPENPYFYEYLSGEEVLKFTAQLFGVAPLAIPELLQTVGLRASARHQPLRTYSKGMLQRLGLAQALLPNPEIVFLDEPMSGLDPLGRVNMRELLLRLKAEGKTIFFNSHLLTDVEMLCDRVGILVQGNLVAQGTLTELLGSEEHVHVTFRVADPSVFSAIVHPLRVTGLQAEGILAVSVENFLQTLTQANGLLLELKHERPNLEAYFLACVGKYQVASNTPDPATA